MAIKPHSHGMFTLLQEAAERKFVDQKSPLPSFCSHVNHIQVPNVTKKRKKAEPSIHILQPCKDLDFFVQQKDSMLLRFLFVSQ